jgi:DNA primase
VDTVALNLIHLLLNYPDRIPVVAEAKILDCLADGDLRELGRLLQEFFDKNGAAGLESSEIIDRIENDLIKKRLLRLMMAEAPPAAEMVDRLLSDTMKQIKRKWYRQQHAVIRRKLITAQKTGDETLCNTLLVEKERLLKEERAL